MVNRGFSPYMAFKNTTQPSPLATTRVRICFSSPTSTLDSVLGTVIFGKVCMIVLEGIEEVKVTEGAKEERVHE